MKQIKDLEHTITECEALAASLDESRENYYRDLYAHLSVAYFASKDINALLQANIPVTKDSDSEVALRDAQGTIAVLETSLEVANKQLSILLSNLEDLINASK